VRFQSLAEKQKTASNDFRHFAFLHWQDGVLLIFLGRSIGLSVTSTAIAFGFCTSVMSAFLPGKQNKPL